MKALVFLILAVAASIQCAAAGQVPAASLVVPEPRTLQVGVPVSVRGLPGHGSTQAAKVITAENPAREPILIARPDSFMTLVNPACSHCLDEAQRRAGDLQANDRVLCWIRGYADGGAIPIRFFLNPYRVISDSYGVFVYDPDAGYARGFAASYDFRFYGWRNGVMVMRHKDGTLYSCLTGLAFAGPKKGTRLQSVPTVEADWGYWLATYPNAVAYHMFDKYQPTEPAARANPDATKSRGQSDPRLREDEIVLGTWSGISARAYPLQLVEKLGMLTDQLGSEAVVVLWEPRTRSAAAYRPTASPPRKYKAPQPGKDGVSPPDMGVLLARTDPAPMPRKLTLNMAAPASLGRFVDAETKSAWDIAGRCVAGELKGWTLEWVDSVQVKWFAWSAENPQTALYADAEPSRSTDAQKAIKEVAGTAEFLRLLPKPFATLKAVDAKQRMVTLLIDGETEPKAWLVEPDAEVKVSGWWGRLEQFKAGDRVWAWLKLDRKRKPASVLMLADEVSELDFHGSLRQKPATKSKLSAGRLDELRSEQTEWLRKRWRDDGLPGTVTFHHVFSGELDFTLDHEAMRWGRSLKLGDVVYLAAEPPIKSVVKTVTPWRERTVVRLVVGELESSELTIGQSLTLKIHEPPAAALNSLYPPDLDRARSRPERIDWFLASMYCACGVSNDTCTGHFYTLASCNPNGCGMPNLMRAALARMIDQGLSDRQVFDELVTQHGPLLLRPHLAP